MNRIRHARLRGWILPTALLVLSAAPAAAGKAPNKDATLGAHGPDVTVYRINGASNYGAFGGVRAYSLGTTSCNVGDQPVNWCDNGGGCSGLADNQHPVIAQNLYRLLDGRFEQIGMSWLKHGFLSTNSFNTDCQGAQGQNCVSPPRGSNELGVGCTDAYGSGLNGGRPLGLRSEVNATTGEFPFPETNVPTSNVIDQRMQVAEVDLDPALNPGALYFGEGQYVSDNDALANNAMNNASYVPLTISGANFDLAFSTSQTVREQSAIEAWVAADPSVERVDVDYVARVRERFQVAHKVTQPVTGVWHHEIVVRNHNSDRAASGLELFFPAGTQISNVGFKDIDHHSGEPYATTDWTITVDNVVGRVLWSTDTFEVDENANALRWGTMFNFWFDTDSPAVPRGGIHYFKPGPNDDPVRYFFFPSAFDGPSAGTSSSLANSTTSAPSAGRSLSSRPARR